MVCKTIYSGSNPLQTSESVTIAVTLFLFLSVEVCCEALITTGGCPPRLMSEGVRLGLDMKLSVSPF